ncbi:hypothetical protein, partial [Frankia sp. EI5c]|uniref:hypothetical protein n=1 Tax=Frankia sp. EI5c TaxID=683316 RepID=UPI001A7EC3F6
MARHAARRVAWRAAPNGFLTRWADLPTGSGRHAGSTHEVVFLLPEWLTGGGPRDRDIAACADCLGELSGDSLGDLTMVVGVSGAGAGVAIPRLKGSLCLLPRRLDDHGDAGAATPAGEGHPELFSRCRRILADTR